MYYEGEEGRVRGVPDLPMMSPPAADGMVTLPVITTLSLSPSVISMCLCNLSKLVLFSILSVS